VRSDSGVYFVEVSGDFLIFFPLQEIFAIDRRFSSHSRRKWDRLAENTA
jgi:hypothetical protein